MTNTDFPRDFSPAKRSDIEQILPGTTFSHHGKNELQYHGVIIGRYTRQRHPYDARYASMPRRRFLISYNKDNFLLYRRHPEDRPNETGDFYILGPGPLGHLLEDMHVRPADSGGLSDLAKDLLGYARAELSAERLDDYLTSVLESLGLTAESAIREIDALRGRPTL